MSGLKISIIISDPEIIRILDEKRGRGEKTQFVAEALRFYIDNAVCLKKAPCLSPVGENSVGEQQSDSLARIEEKLESILEMLGPHPLQQAPEPDSVEAEEKHQDADTQENNLPGTELSRRFSAILAETLKTSEWS